MKWITFVVILAIVAFGALAIYEPAQPFWIMNVNGHMVKDHGDI